MTITKKILTTSVTILAIAGMVLMSTPAHAGFFDWFNKTPLNQGAQSIKSVETKNVEYKVSGSTSKTGDVDNEKIEDQKESSSTSFFKTLFSRSPRKVSPVQVNQTPSKSDNSGTVYKQTGKESSDRTISDEQVYIAPSPVQTSTDLTPEIVGDASKDFVDYGYFEKKIRRGDQDDEVVKLQLFLAGLDYYKIEIDGQYGEGTQKAVKLFQSDNNQRLTSGNVVGSKTLSFLNSQLRKMSQAPDGKSSTAYAWTDVIIKNIWQDAVDGNTTPIAKLTSGELPFRWPEIRYPLGPIVYGPGGPVDPGSLPNPACGNNVTFKNLNLPFPGEVYLKGTSIPLQNDTDLLNIEVTTPGNCSIRITGFSEAYSVFDVLPYDNYYYRIPVRVYLNGAMFGSKHIRGNTSNTFDINYHPAVSSGQTKYLTFASDPRISKHYSAIPDVGPNTNYGDWIPVDQISHTSPYSNPSETRTVKLGINKIHYEVTNVLVNGQNPQFTKTISMEGPNLIVLDRPANTYYFTDPSTFSKKTMDAESTEDITWDHTPHSAHDSWDTFAIPNGPIPDPGVWFINQILDAAQWAIHDFFDETTMEFCYPSDQNPTIPVCSNQVDSLSGITYISDTFGEPTYISNMSVSNSTPGHEITRTGKIRIKNTNGTRKYYSPYNVTVTSSDLY